MEKRRLEAIEAFIFSVFKTRDTSRLLAREVFESSTEFSNADLVRAFEDLEKRWRLLVRHTNEGHDWISLTPEGATHVGVPLSDDNPGVMPHPPRSSTIQM